MAGDMSPAAIRLGRRKLGPELNVGGKEVPGNLVEGRRSGVAADRDPLYVQPSEFQPLRLGINPGGY